MCISQSALVELLISKLRQAYTLLSHLATIRSSKESDQLGPNIVC